LGVKQNDMGVIGVAEIQRASSAVFEERMVGVSAVASKGRAHGPPWKTCWRSTGMWSFVGRPDTWGLRLSQETPPFAIILSSSHCSKSTMEYNVARNSCDLWAHGRHMRHRQSPIWTWWPTWGRCHELLATESRRQALAHVSARSDPHHVRDELGLHDGMLHASAHQACGKKVTLSRSPNCVAPSGAALPPSTTVSCSYPSL